MSTELTSEGIRAAKGALAGLRVMTIGGANVEHGYSLPGGFERDAKVTIEPEPRLSGGSSVNHSARLLAMGVEVHPVLPLAAEDPMSGVILSALESAAKVGNARLDRDEIAIDGAGLMTPYTTIIRQGDSRAVLNEYSGQMMSAFDAHLDRHLEIARGIQDEPAVVLVGHIHADRSPPVSPTPSSAKAVGFGGALTERILTAEELASARKFVNFGRAQYALGAERWSGLLRDRVDVFQLGLEEVHHFVQDLGLENDSLASILDWFRERATVVITLGRFGAVGQLAGSDQPVAVWPSLVDAVVDSTGAGDAMGAGIVAAMTVDPFDDSDVTDGERLERFARALAFGRTCGAYACTTLGGAEHCPDLESLVAFEREAPPNEQDQGLRRTMSDHDLYLIDRAFER